MGSLLVLVHSIFKYVLLFIFVAILCNYCRNPRSDNEKIWETILATVTSARIWIAVVIEIIIVITVHVFSFKNDDNSCDKKRMKSDDRKYMDLQSASNLSFPNMRRVKINQENSIPKQVSEDSISVSICHGSSRKQSSPKNPPSRRSSSSHTSSSDSPSHYSSSRHSLSSHVSEAICKHTEKNKNATYSSVLVSKDIRDTRRQDLCDLRGSFQKLSQSSHSLSCSETKHKHNKNEYNSLSNINTGNYNFDLETMEHLQSFVNPISVSPHPSQSIIQETPTPRVHLKAHRKASGGSLLSQLSESISPEVSECSDAVCSPLYDVSPLACALPTKIADYPVVSSLKKEEGPAMSPDQVWLHTVTTHWPRDHQVSSSPRLPPPSPIVDGHSSSPLSHSNQHQSPVLRKIASAHSSSSPRSLVSRPGRLMLSPSHTVLSHLSLSSSDKLSESGSPDALFSEIKKSVILPLIHNVPEDNKTRSRTSSSEEDNCQLPKVELSPNCSYNIASTNSTLPSRISLLPNRCLNITSKFMKFRPAPVSISQHRQESTANESPPL